MSKSSSKFAAHGPSSPAARSVFTRNSPFDHKASIALVIEPLFSSRAYMQSIRDFPVPADALAIWFFGQNGFVLKNAAGTLFGIDLYLSNSCAATFANRVFRLDRQLPVFVEPEDLDIDIFIATHSHQDHADPETLCRLNQSRVQCFVGPWDAVRIYRQCGVPAASCRLIHPGETFRLSDETELTATFALPTDATDLNHTGVLLAFTNGIRFFNTGDTAFAERLPALLPRDLDICSICINGGFHNLSPTDAAAIVAALRPRVAVPTHYDMMINNVGDPDMFRMVLHQNDSTIATEQLPYYEPWLYRRAMYERS